MAIGPILSPASWLNGTVVSPAWLQSVQDNINGMIAGTGPTLKALQLDGTGGAGSAQPSGTLGLSGAIIGASYVRGLLGKEMLPVALGAISISNPSCSVVSAYNMASVARAGAGTYNVTLSSAVPVSGNQYGFANGVDGNTRGIPTVQAAITSSTNIQIYTFNSSGTLTDPSSAMTLFVFGFSLV